LHPGERRLPGCRRNDRGDQYPSIDGAGFDPTPGTWAFSTQSAGGISQASFTFSADTAAVPDGGPTVALLGIALGGMEAVRRMLRARAKGKR
jgi:hypothetical protein